MKLNDHIKEIEKQFDEFGFIDKLTKRMDQDADTPSELRHFLTSKLREIATATLAACEVEDIGDDFIGQVVNDNQKSGWNAAISEQKKKAKDWLEPKA